MEGQKSMHHRSTGITLLEIFDGSASITSALEDLGDSTSRRRGDNASEARRFLLSGRMGEVAAYHRLCRSRLT